MRDMSTTTCVQPATLQRTHRLRTARVVRRRQVCAAAPAQRQEAASAAAEAPAATAVGQSGRRAALASLLAGLAAVNASPATAGEGASREGEVRYSDAEWRQRLSPEAYAILRQARTERRNSSPLVQEKRTGTFVCGGCGQPLFASETKFESGTGWPSFFDALPQAVELEPDNSIPFMPRVEVRCSRCLGHLGHVFPDGPKPTGLRFCMNGAALQFEPQQA